jgi:hypothetical protein
MHDAASRPSPRPLARVNPIQKGRLKRADQSGGAARQRLRIKKAQTPMLKSTRVESTVENGSRSLGK